MSHYEAVNDNAGAAPPRERRRQVRQPAYLKGKIVYPHNTLTADCLIRDICEGGARISVNPEAIADRPFLIVVRKAVVHATSTAWRTAEQAGLRFHGAADLTAETPLHLTAIQRIWLELAPR